MPSPKIHRFLVSLASLVIIVAGLKLASELLGSVLLALFIVLATNPLVEWLRLKRVPKILSYFIVVLVVVVIGLLLISFLGLSITQLTATLPAYRSLIDTQISSLVAWLSARGIEGADLLELDLISPGRVIQVILGFISGLLETLSNVGLMLFIFIYMLVGASSFSRKLNQGLGQNNSMKDRVHSFTRSISVYLAIKTWLGAMAAIGQIVLLWFLGVDFAILWGVLSFLFNYIPNIGYLIALIPPVLMALIQYGFLKALIVFVGYAVINNFFDVVIGPRYLGKGLDLSTLVTFLAVIFWTWILGPIGAFLALPLTVMLKKLVLESFEETKLLASLIGTEQDLEP